MLNQKFNLKKLNFLVDNGNQGTTDYFSVDF